MPIDAIVRACRSRGMTGAAILFALTVACGSRDKYVPGSVRQVLGIQTTEVRSAIAARMDSSSAPAWVTKEDWTRVRSLYKVFGDAPLWLEADGVKDRASALLQSLDEAPSHALQTFAYPIDSIRRVVDGEALAKRATPAALAEADVVLTAAFVAYASDMLMGQVDPKTISQAWHIAARKSEVDSALVRTLQTPNIASGLAAMVPQDSGYAVLRSEYARYQNIVASGGWKTVSSGSGGTALHDRLATEGYAVDSATGSQREALKSFQERHGLAPNGKLDGFTLTALNVSAEDRMHDIGSNMERMRWLPRLLGSRYIYVNVPAFRLEAYDSGQKKLEMKVVVGAEYQGRATPVFSDSMEFVVFRPYWNVTPSIAAKEFFPKYGTALPAGYETYHEKGALRIRQVPGDRNSLGLVKFMFPNDFNIYLHDTPAKALFDRADRAASHGCIRLEKPDELAEFVLGWDADRVHAAMHGADNRTVNIPTKIPVYIVYFTAYALDGQLYFGDDLYNRDDQLDDKLKGDSLALPRVSG
ncbi:MAG TPA: L,D-transpeptidase family protein [Gemmatimonadaceae bacterium]|nr:L,D-transpeptidase family protein [Gemmatimonadaceae bacterium]